MFGGTGEGIEPRFIHCDSEVQHYIAPVILPVGVLFVFVNFFCFRIFSKTKRTKTFFLWNVSDFNDQKPTGLPRIGSNHPTFGHNHQHAEPLLV